MLPNFELFICGSQIRSMSTEAAVAMQEFNTSYTVEVMACTQAGCGVKSSRHWFFVPAIGELNNIGQEFMNVFIPQYPNVFFLTRIAAFIFE